MPQIENQAKEQLKVPNPLFRTSLMKKDSSKDLLEKKEATKMTSIQELEQGTYYEKNYFMANLNIFLVHILYPIQIC